jgi:hypothetical protein
MKVSTIISDIIQIINRSHSDLQNLNADDHSQYLNVARHDLTTRHTLGTVVPHDDHGLLSGLSDDDHSQYLNTARHDVKDRHPLTVLGNSGGAQGDILYWDGSNWVRLAPGTSGYFLKTQGAGASPVWGAVLQPLTLVKTTSDQNNSTTTLEDITGLSFSLTAGVYYHFRFLINFRVSNTARGLNLAIVFPTVTTFAAKARIPSGSAGTDAESVYFITSSGLQVGPGTIDAANQNRLADVEGVILPSANGTLKLQFCISANGSYTATIKQGSCGILTTLS